MQSRSLVPVTYDAAPDKDSFVHKYTFSGSTEAIFVCDFVEGGGVGEVAGGRFA